MEYCKKIDGYRLLEETRMCEGKRIRDIIITYYCNGIPFIDPKRYKNVPEETIKKIREKLWDYTEHNLNEPQISRTIPFFTIMGEVERMIYQ